MCQILSSLMKFQMDSPFLPQFQTQLCLHLPIGFQLRRLGKGEKFEKWVGFRESKFAIFSVVIAAALVAEAEVAEEVGEGCCGCPT